MDGSLPAASPLHPASGPARRSWRTAPPQVRRAGTVWLVLVGAWVAPALVGAMVDPDAPTIIGGWVGPATAALVMVAVTATVAWGSVLRTHGLRPLAVPSTVLGTVVVLVWCQALAVAWTRGSSDLNPEAVVLILGATVVLSALVIAGALAVGCAPRPHRSSQAGRTGPRAPAPRTPEPRTPEPQSR